MSETSVKSAEPTLKTVLLSTRSAPVKFQCQFTFTQIMDHSPLRILIAITKKRFKMDASLYTNSQIIDTTQFEKMPLYQLLTKWEYKTEAVNRYKQLNLFVF